ncbi:hypothetical protein [Caballeronia glathei]|uniref:Uncharacterized protein n=1 Tax=Caballeronia glathei TaxID=60547 RepID=A0A069PB63_9BURK|nr:hypothetical protein BG61_08700 [Caballeronia glathei]
MAPTIAAVIFMVLQGAAVGLSSARSAASLQILLCISNVFTRLALYLLSVALSFLRGIVGHLSDQNS